MFLPLIKKRSILLFLFTFITLLIWPRVAVHAASGINRQINFQGKLVNNPAATNVTDTSYTVVFTIYDNASGGTALWTETQTVTTQDGIFHVALGSVTPIPSSFNFNWSGLYLGMKVNSDTEMSPRIQLASVPYAFNAGQVAGLTVQDTSGNASTSAILKIGDATTSKTFDLGANNLTFTTSGDTTLALPTSGTVTALGNTTTGTGTTLVLSSNPSFAGITLSSGGISLGGTTSDSSHCIVGGATAAWGSCGIGGGGSSPFAEITGVNGGVVVANNSTEDLLIGGQSTASATFHVFGSALGGTNPVASISANTSFAGLVVDQAGIGDVFTASTSGITRLTVNQNGFVSLGQSGVANGGLVFNSIGASVLGASITTDSLGNLILTTAQANSTVQVGSGNGNITLSLSHAADVLTADKTVTLSGAYTGLDYTFSRALTGGVNNQGGAVLYITDTSGGSGTINPDLILGNEALTSGSFTGNLLRLQISGSDIFVASSSGILVSSGLSSSNFAPLTIGNSQTGDLTIAPGSGKNIALNTTGILSSNATTVNFSSAALTVSSCSGCGGGSSAFAEITGANGGLITANNSTEDLLLGGQSTASATFHFFGSALGGTQPVASVAAKTSFAGLVVDQAGVGDVFTASTSGATRFTVTGSGNVQIGSGGSSSPSLLILDTKTDNSSDPTGVKGAMYYNTTLDTFRCYKSGAWQNCGADVNKQQYAKSADQSVTNSNVLQDETALQFTMGAGETWVFQYFILASNNNSATPDWKSAILASGASSCNVTMSGAEPAGAVFPQATTTDCTTPGTLVDSNISASAIPYQVYIQGVVTDSGSGSIVKLQFAENTAGSSTSNTIKAGSYLVAYKATGADLAETYFTNDQSIGPGDVVSIDGSLNAGVKKSELKNDPSVLGIISTQPGLVMADATSGGGRPVFLALSGRVPVKVSTESGEIKSGDYLTTSSTPGVAMRAIGNVPVIAQAMSGFSGEGTGEVLAFIKNQTYTFQEPLGLGGNQNYISSVSSQFSNINIDSAGLATISADLNVSGSGIFNGMLTVLKSITTPNLLVSDFASFMGDTFFKGNVRFGSVPTFSSDTAGTAIIPKGQDRVDISFNNEYLHVPLITASISFDNIVATASADENKALEDSIRSGNYSFFITRKTTKGFTIILNKQAEQDINFSWIALSVDNPQVSTNDNTQSQSISVSTNSAAFQSILGQLNRR